MISKEVFIGGMHDLHSAMYGLELVDEKQYELITALVSGYMILLGDLNIEAGKRIQEFILTHRKFDPEEVEGFYTLLFAEPSEYMN